MKYIFIFIVFVLFSVLSLTSMVTSKSKYSNKPILINTEVAKYQDKLYGYKEWSINDTINISRILNLGLPKSKTLW
jgi:hypothetical protein